MRQSLKSQLKEAQSSVGSWLQINSPDVAELMAGAGFDWLCVDMEHGAIEVPDLPNLFRAIRNGGSIPLVRLSENCPFLIKRVLDAGAEGIIVPMIKSAAEIRAAVAATRYPPQGIRGIGFARCNQHGVGFPDYFEGWNDRVVVVAQIEHIDAVRDIDNIFACEGVDAFLIGPYDLSGSMDMTGQFEAPEVKAAIRDTLEAGRRHGVPAGIHVIPPDPDEVRRRIEEGFRFIAVSLDAYMLGELTRRVMKEIREHL